MEYVNLTDTDARHYLTGKYNPHSYATTTVGRTGSGIIIETGQKVHDVKPGDKVFVKPVSCGTCSLCLSDQRNLCESVTASELSPMAGVLSRLHVHSSEFVTKIPENVSVLSGAMCWMLSAAIRACQKSSVSAGDVVLVIGGGALGMATSLAAQLLGATTVCFAGKIRDGSVTEKKIQRIPFTQKISENRFWTMLKKLALGRCSTSIRDHPAKILQSNFGNKSVYIPV